jgi:hypothetical protein
MDSGDHDFHDVFLFTLACITKMNEKLRALNQQGGNTTALNVYYNTRPAPHGKRKHSFHLHWTSVVFNSVQALAHVAREVSDAVHGEFVAVDGMTCVMDPKVYGNNKQLFRLPYCGKFGERGTALTPIRMHLQPATQRWEKVDIEGEKAKYIKQSVTFTIFGENFINLEVQNIHRPVLTRAALPTYGIINNGDEDKTVRRKWLNFFEPVLKKIILPNWFRMRAKMAATHHVDVAIPTASPLHIESIQKIGGYPASYRVSVHGDNFCQYDRGDTPYRHMGSANAITYVVDLYNGKMAQQCMKCRPSPMVWYSFIQEGVLSFDIMPFVSDSRHTIDVVTTNKRSDVVAFFLSIFDEEILFCKEQNKVYAYDRTTGIWVCGSDGNRLVLEMVSNMNKWYIAYCIQRNDNKTDDLVAQWDNANADADADDRELAIAKMNKQCRKANSTISKLWNIPLQTEAGLINQLRARIFPNTQERMESMTHLVPLKDCKCIDIHTWKLMDISPEFMFTSIINASIIDMRDETVDEFVKWQKQVCCGDEEYMEWKMCIMGLSLTFLNFDRAFYMPLGPVGRNGKSSESFLFSEATMSTTPNRGYTMSREYLTKASQDKKGANAADTVLMDVNNKTVVIADECRDTALDGALIKSFVSGDRTNARNLYEGERTAVLSKFTLWIIANKTIKLDYGDSALMNRARIMPYNAQWVKDPVSVRAKLAQPLTAFVFKEDPYFKEKTLSTWVDAFVTKTLHMLHRFLATLPRDPDMQERPLKLVSFPIPKVVVAFTRAKIEKEHPVLAFINKHLVKVNVDTPYVTVDIAFTNFRQFARNDNSFRAKALTKTQFCEDLSKEHIECMAVLIDGLPVYHLDGYKLSHEVPNLERPVDIPMYAGNPLPLLVNNDNHPFDYVPPPIKRSYDESNF